jgi:hypothetical protein
MNKYLWLFMVSILCIPLSIKCSLGINSYEGLVLYIRLIGIVILWSQRVIYFVHINLIELFNFGVSMRHNLTMNVGVFLENF